MPGLRGFRPPGGNRDATGARYSITAPGPDKTLERRLYDLERYSTTHEDGTTDENGRDLEGQRRALRAEERDFWRAPERKAREERRAARQRDWREPIRLYLQAVAEGEGVPLDELLSVMHRGRPTEAQRGLRDVLARAVFALSARFTLQQIGDALEKRRQTIDNLSDHGRALAEQDEREARGRAEEEAAAERAARMRPCRRHAAFQRDCPACLRNAPEGAVTNRFPAFEGLIAGGSP